jgi:hypothetical protein
MLVVEDGWEWGMGNWQLVKVYYAFMERWQAREIGIDLSAD